LPLAKKKGSFRRYGDRGRQKDKGRGDKEVLDHRLSEGGQTRAVKYEKIIGGRKKRGGEVLLKRKKPRPKEFF